MATLGKIPTEMFSQLNDELQGVYLKFSYSALPVKHLETDNREIRRKVKKKKNWLAFIKNPSPCLLAVSGGSTLSSPACLIGGAIFHSTGCDVFPFREQIIPLGWVDDCFVDTLLFIKTY